jgi:hypothetical protein
MSVSNPEDKIEWGADSEPRKNERVPSSDKKYTLTLQLDENIFFEEVE